MNEQILARVEPAGAMFKPRPSYCPCGMGPLVGQEIAVGACYACVAMLLANKAVGR